MGPWKRMGRWVASVDMSSVAAVLSEGPHHLCSATARCSGEIVSRSCAAVGDQLNSLSTASKERPLLTALVGTFAAGLVASWSCAQAEDLKDGGGDISVASGKESTQVELVEGSLQIPPEGAVVSNDHTARWRIYTNMGRELFSQGRLDEAEKYFTRALEEAKLGFGEEDPHVASSCNNLAELYRLKRDYAKAEPLYLEAVQRLERAMGADAPGVGFALHNLGSFYFIQRRFEEARECYRRALKIKGRTMGFDHPEYASTLFHLGEVARVLGDLAVAEAYIGDSLRILEEAGGAHSKPAVLRMGRLAEIFVHTGKLQEAENLQRKLLHILELSEGPESLNVATAADNLAVTLQAEDKLTEAEELLQRCLYIRQQALAPDNVQIGSVLFKLASVDLKLGEKLCNSKEESDREAGKAEYEKAEQLLLRAMRIAEQILEEVSGVAAKVARASKVDDGVNRAESISKLVGQSLLALVRSLNALALLQIRRAECDNTKEAAQARMAASSFLRRILSVLEQTDYSTHLSSWPDVQKEHLVCLKRLADLLSTVPKDASKNEAAEQLLKRASAIEAQLASSKASD